MTDIGQLRSLAMVPTRLFGLHGMKGLIPLELF